MADNMGVTPVLGTLDSGSTQEGSLLDAIALWSREDRYVYALLVMHSMCGLLVHG